MGIKLADIRNSRFIGNSNGVDGLGGSLYLVGTRLNVVYSEFIQNTAGQWGGAIYGYDASGIMIGIGMPYCYDI